MGAIHFEISFLPDNEKKTVTAPKGNYGLLDVLYFYILQVLVRTKKENLPPFSPVPALLRPLCFHLKYRFIVPQGKQGIQAESTSLTTLIRNTPDY